MDVYHWGKNSFCLSSVARPLTHIFKAIALSSLILVSPEHKISASHSRELEAAISQISCEHASYCSVLTLLFLGVGTGSEGGDEFITHGLLHIQQAASCSMMHSVNPIFTSSRKENSLGSACNSNYKNFASPGTFSPKSFRLEISYGRFPYRWATAGRG